MSAQVCQKRVWDSLTSPLLFPESYMRLTYSWTPRDIRERKRRMTKAVFWVVNCLSLIQSQAAILITHNWSFKGILMPILYMGKQLPKGFQLSVSYFPLEATLSNNKSVNSSADILWRTHIRINWLAWQPSRQSWALLQKTGWWWRCHASLISASSCTSTNVHTGSRFTSSELKR